MPLKFYCHPHWLNRVSEANCRVKTFYFKPSLRTLIIRLSSKLTLHANISGCLTSCWVIVLESDQFQTSYMNIHTKLRMWTNGFFRPLVTEEMTAWSCLPFTFCAEVYSLQSFSKALHSLSLGNLNRKSETVWLIFALNKWSDSYELHSQQIRRVINEHLGAVTSSIGTSGSWREHLLSISGSLVLNSLRSTASEAEIEL